MLRKYIVSAYATSPSFYKWDPTLEKDYFKQLAACPEIMGIEHPFLLDSEKYPLNWLVENIPDHWELVITTLPIFMQMSKDDPNIGLASTHEPSRSLSVSIVNALNQYVHKLNETFGRKIVKAINFHSSPKSYPGAVKSSGYQLEKSLSEIAEMEWSGIALNIEHCDAYDSMVSSLPDKGFLPLNDEIEAIKKVGHFGIVLNWGRSVIEMRSIKGAVKHIQASMQENLLRGFFFSGCTDTESSPYGAWKDTHIPPQNFINGRHLQNDSLLGAAEIKKVFQNLKNEEVYLGIKILDPKSERELNRLVGLNLETIAAIESVRLVF